jgi:DNA repair photolyase
LPRLTCICRYCYARAFYTRADRGNAADFDRLIYVKRNAPHVLRTELARRSWKRELVLIGAATDPYRPAEARFGIARGILEALRDLRTPVSVITKGPLAGIQAGVFLAPILPGISDSKQALGAVIDAAAEAGAPYVMPITLRLAPGVREWFLPYLSKYYPALTRDYCRSYQQTEAPLAYKRGALGLAARLIEAYGLETGPGIMEKAPALAPEPMQMRLSI